MHALFSYSSVAMSDLDYLESGLDPIAPENKHALNVRLAGLLMVAFLEVGHPSQRLTVNPSKHVCFGNPIPWNHNM